MPKNRKVLEMQSAHLTKAEKEQRKQQEQAVTVGAESLARTPTWLVDNVAKQEWRRITKELAKIEIVGNLDYANLAGYCNAYANYRRVSDELRGQSYCIERVTSTGFITVKNPLVDIQTTYAAEMRKFAGLCGLTIDSRLKAAVKKVDKQDEELNRRFGGI